MSERFLDLNPNVTTDDMAGTDFSDLTLATESDNNDSDDSDASSMISDVSTSKRQER